MRQWSGSRRCKTSSFTCGVFPTSVQNEFPHFFSFFPVSLGCYSLSLQFSQSDEKRGRLMAVLVLQSGINVSTVSFTFTPKGVLYIVSHKKDGLVGRGKQKVRKKRNFKCIALSMVLSATNTTIFTFQITSTK